MRRYPEIDFLRTLAIVMMVAYHLAFDLAVFYGYAIDIFGGAWHVLAVCTASLFLLLVGASSRLLWQGMDAAGYSLYQMHRRFLRRGATVLACGMGITVLTYIVEPGAYIRFGILHLIGVSLLLCSALSRYGRTSLCTGIALLASARLVGATDNPSPLLFPLGIHDYTLNTWDYFPLIPWFGVVLLGIGAASIAYNGNCALSREGSSLRQWLDAIFRYRWARWTLLPGRRSLLLYLVHQPVLLAMLWLLLGWPKLS
jgi:uncharacterized membrane protein